MRHQHVVLAIVAIVLSACHSNFYSTPRTVPTGQGVHIVAVHAEPYPAMVYIVRGGLADRVDLGFHASLYFNKLDVKFNFLRTKYFDMAINPGLSYGYEPVVHDYRFKGSFPLMLGLNAGPWVTLMFQGGPVLMQFRDPSASWVPEAQEPTVVMGAIGGALQIRVADWLYIQPEVSINYFKYDPVDGTRYWPNFGIGFGFGRQPRYDDPGKRKD